MVLIHLKRSSLDDEEDEEFGENDERDIKQTKRIRDWRSQAYGHKQNMFNLIIRFLPQTHQHLQSGKCEVWAEICYQINENMKTQFPDWENKYPKVQLIKLTRKKVAQKEYSYDLDLELPYGTYTSKLMYKYKYEID